MESVSPLRPRGPARCPYCHDALEPSAPQTACGNCAAAHHADCFQELGKCASCGQGAVREFVTYRAPQAEPTPVSRLVIKALLFGVLPIVVLWHLTRAFPAIGCSATLIAATAIAAAISRARRGLG